jgi:choline dehydrogenase-like flavoprotein
VSGAIVDLSREIPRGPFVVDVCIVGSGSGGATAAWEFARAGREVIVLEEGGDFTGAALTGRDTMYDQVYMDRGGRTTDDMAISVLQGRVLGGGGVINACDVVPIHDGIARHWQKAYGLSDFSPEALAPFTKQALEDLSANMPREDQINANNAVLRDGAKALGWRGEAMLHNRVGCQGLGKCLVGCPVDAKKNPRFVAIPAALEKGARFFTRARAVRIDDAGDEIKRVTVRALDAKGYHEQGEIEVRAKTVILAANAVGSAQLLLRSGLGNAHVGKNLMLQPQLPIVATFERELALFRGIPQSYAVTEFEDLASAAHGFWGFRIEGIGGTPGIVSSLLPNLGHPGKELMKGFGRMAAALLLLPDEGHGTVTVKDDGRAKIAYAMADETKARFRDAVRAATRLYFAAGATQVIVPCVPPLVMRKETDLSAVDRLTFAPATTPFLSAHQQGSVRFAATPDKGAADPTGQVFGTRGVHVLDSSGYPTSSSSHTMTPILTTARYLARRMIG